MERLLITLRHPGPTQVIASILSTLQKRYKKVAVVASDTALILIQERFNRYIHGIDLYYSRNGAWQILSENCLDRVPVRGDNLEFESQYDEGYKNLVFSFSKLLKEYNPDIVLRTTPAMKWGIDEALVEACKKSGINCSYRCYQEYYGCGINLESFPYAVATIDKYAQALLREKEVKSIVTGWLNQTVFKEYRPYEEARAQTRAQLGLKEIDIAILYCTVASGNIDAELKHFYLFLQSVKSPRIYIKFHPRNTEYERRSYMVQAINKECICVDMFSIDGVLAFPDFTVSVASAINLDMLEYQVMAQLPVLKCVSVFTKGILTESILLSAIGEKSIPISQSGMGSLIVDEYNYENIFNCSIEQQKVWLYECAKRIFDVSAEKSINRFLKYLEKTKIN